jgi:hypothetical protein
LYFYEKQGVRETETRDFFPAWDKVLYSGKKLSTIFLSL